MSWPLILVWTAVFVLVAEVALLRAFDMAAPRRLPFIARCSVLVAVAASLVEGLLL